MRERKWDTFVCGEADRVADFVGRRSLFLDIGGHEGGDMRDVRGVAILDDTRIGDYSDIVWRCSEQINAQALEGRRDREALVVGVAEIDRHVL